MRKRYKLLRDEGYMSPRYNKWVLIKKGYTSDGASGAIDIDGPVACLDLQTGKLCKKSLSWWVHDKLCDTGRWADGTPCSNWQASMVLKDILFDEGHFIRDHWWMVSTFIYRVLKTKKL